MTDSSTPPQTSPLQELAKHALSPMERSARVQAAQLLRVLCWQNPRCACHEARRGLHYWIGLVASTVPADGSYRTLSKIFSTRIASLREAGELPQEPPPPLPVPPDEL